MAQFHPYTVEFRLVYTPILYPVRSAVAFQQLWDYRFSLTASGPRNPNYFFMALDGGTGSKLGHVAIIVAGYISLVQLIQPGLTFARGFFFFSFLKCLLTYCYLAGVRVSTLDIFCICTETDSIN